jgi:fibronectin type 3 domain-containing protein
MLQRRPARGRTRTLVGLGAAVAVLMGLTGVWAVANAAGTAYFVSPTGLDTNAGTSAAAPFKSIQKALDLAAPGSTITLAPGVYRQSIVTKTDGTAASPITIKGSETGKDVSGRYKTVLSGTSGGNVISINNSYYTLDGFTINGQPGIDRTEYPTTLDQVRAFKDAVKPRAVNSKLVYVGADVASHDITGTRISNMFLNGSGGECVRFRNRAAASLIVNSVIQWCGMYGQGDDVTQYRYHNGEGVYVGTSPKSTDQPLFASDTSNGIVIRDSVVHTFGAECLEVKENAHDNRIEDSDCGFNDEPLSFKGSNFELRGDHNLIRRTTVHDSRSWNVKMASDSAQYNLGGNSIELSSFDAAAAPALRADQSTTGSSYCGNTFTATPYAEGSSAIGDPRQPCVAVDTQRPTVSITGPANGAVVAGTIPITADATDDGGVTRVDFEVDGTPLGSATAAPWSQNWAVPTAPGPHTITATAHDAADNVATAQIAVTAGADVIPPAAPVGATVQATSATSATVSWTAATDNVGVTGYRVLRNGKQIGTTTTALTYTDGALTAGTTASYTVVAVDAAGNVSAASNSAVISTPAAQAVAIEAESGTVTAPMTAASDAAAQGGKYVVQTTGSGTGKATYRVPVPIAASFVLAARVIAPSTSSDSFTYSLDGGPAQVLNLPSSARTAWTWFNGPTIPLSVGTHTLVISKRENGARLDALTLTPPGASALPSTPTPTPTATPTIDPTPTTLPPAPTTAPPTTAPVTTTAMPTATTVPPSTTSSAPVTTTTTPPPVIPLGTSPFEAEAGTLTTGMAVAADAKASGGRCVVARSAGGTATFTISIPTAGTYMVAGWIKAPTTMSDSFTVRFDTGATAVWNLTEPTTSWTSDVTSNPTFALPAGTHKLTLSYREAGASVDRLQLLKR